MILVVGTGRCGTSDVSRILHEELGVDMGRSFHVGDKFNPKGYYEDREIQSLNLSFYLMNLDNIDYEQPWRLWKDRLKHFMDTKKEPWGIKDPGIADFPKLLEVYLHLNPKVVWCKRDKESTVKSYMKFKDVSKKEAERIYDQRWNNITKALEDRDYLEIDCYEEDKDLKLKQLL